MALYGSGQQTPYGTAYQQQQSGNLAGGIYGTGQQSPYGGGWGQNTQKQYNPYATQGQNKTGQQIGGGGQSPNWGGQNFAGQQTWKPTYSYGPFDPSGYQTFSDPIFQPGGPSATVPFPHDPSIDFIDENGQPHYNPQYGQSNNNGGGGGGGQPPPTSGEGPPLYLPGQQPPTNSVGGLVQQGGQGQMPANGGWTGWGISQQQYEAMNPEQRAIYDQWMAGYLPGQIAQWNQQGTEWNRNQDAYRWGVTNQQGQTQQTWENKMAENQFGLTKDQADFQKWLAQQNLGLEQQGLGHQIWKDKETLDFEKLKNTQQYGLALTDQELRDRIQSGQLQNETKMTDAQIADLKARLGLDIRKQSWEESIGTRQQDFLEKSGLLKLAQEGKLNDAQIKQILSNIGLNERAQGLSEELGRGDLGLRTRAQGFAEEMGRGELGFKWGELGSNERRWQGEQGLEQQKITNEANFRNRELLQQADQFAKTHGLSIEQVKNTRWFQEQTVAIDRDRMVQEAALAREQMASNERNANMAAFGRLQAPRAKVIRNF